MIASRSRWEVSALSRWKNEWIAQVRAEAPLLFFFVLSIPVFAVLDFLYTHQPGFNPDVIPFDVRVYFEAASAILSGKVPYRDWFFQYPPASLLFFVPPRLVAQDLVQYLRLFQLELMLLYWIGLVLTAKIARRLGQSLTQTLFLYSCALPLLGSIVVQRYDLAPAVVVLLTLAAWLYDREGLTWFLLALGILTKAYPLFLLPLFLIAQWRTKGNTALFRGLGMTAFWLALGALPLWWLSNGKMWSDLGLQASRGLEIESTYATLSLVGQFLGVPAEPTYNSQLGAWEVTSPIAAPLQFVAVGLQMMLFIVVCLRWFRTPRLAPEKMLGYSVVMLVVVLLTSKVFSPQYMLWLFPLPFMVGKKKFALASVLFLFAALLTHLVNPFLWTALKQVSALAVGILLLRDVALGALGVWLFFEFNRDAPTRAASVRGGEGH